MSQISPEICQTQNGQAETGQAQTTAPDPSPNFTCRECGCETLHVYRYAMTVAHHLHYKPCRCGNTTGLCAAIQHWTQVEFDIAYSELNNQHLEDFETLRRTEDCLDHINDPEVYCGRCHQAQDWQTQYNASSENLDEEVCVRCAGCDRDIEFHWDEPNHMSRIWPAECRDYIAERGFPEPAHRFMLPRR